MVFYSIGPPYCHTHPKGRDPVRAILSFNPSSPRQDLGTGSPTTTKLLRRDFWLTATGLWSLRLLKEEQFPTGLDSLSLVVCWRSPRTFREILSKLTPEGRGPQVVAEKVDVGLDRERTGGSRSQSMKEGPGPEGVQEYDTDRVGVSEGWFLGFYP